MNKTVLIYGAVLALAAFVLQWLDYQHSVRVFATEIYIIIIAVGFTVLGLWIGRRLTGRQDGEFRRNSKAIEALGISDREYQVLELLAKGHSNQEIADSLFISLNTIKTHIANLYQKLGVSRRTQAVNKARSLNLVR